MVHFLCVRVTKQDEQALIGDAKLRQNKIKILYENLKITNSVILIISKVLLCTFVIGEGSRGYGFIQASYHVEGRDGKHSLNVVVDTHDT